MDNPNSNKFGEVKRYRPKSLSDGGILTITREKLVIVIVMAAVAALLLAIAILLTFSGDEPLGILKRNHVHDYDVKIELVGGKINLLGHCDVKKCDAPDFLEENVSGVTVSTVAQPTCISEGRRVYTLVYEGKELFCEEVLAKIPHLIDGETVDRFKNEDGHLIYNGENIGVSVSDAVLECGAVFSEDVGYFRCSSCLEKVGASVTVPHKCTMELVYEDSSFYMVYDCIKVGCDEVIKYDVSDYVTKVEEKLGTCASKAVTYYEYSYGGETIGYVVEGEKDPNNHAMFEMAKKEDGTYDYVKGFTVSISGADITCGGGKSGKFYLKCPDCGETGNINEIVVNLPDHIIIFKKGDVINMPTLTEKGTVLLTCENRWCDHKIEVEIDKVVIGDGGNTFPILTSSGEATGRYRYKTKTAQGIDVELILTLDPS